MTVPVPAGSPYSSVFSIKERWLSVLSGAACRSGRGAAQGSVRPQVGRAAEFFPWREARGPEAEDVGKVVTRCCAAGL